MLPKISIVTVTLNSDRTLEKYFDCIINQSYPKHKIEILIVDGGSDDKTLNISKRYSSYITVRIIKTKIRDNQEARRLISFRKAKNDIICILDSDNYLTDKYCLRKLVAPLIKEKNLVGSFTLHYKYDSNQTIFNRYVGLFGVLDSVIPYLKKNDRHMITVKSWPNNKQIVKTTKEYTVLKFEQDDFPTLGCNGFVINKKILQLSKYKPEDFFHTDILYDLVNDGLNRYAVVDAEVLHDTAATIKSLVKKRIKYMSMHHIKLSNKRRYKVFDSSNPNDRRNLIIYIIFTVTIVEPMYQSIKGFIRVRDFAWFFHPIGCWLFLISYSYSTIRYRS